MTTPKNRNAVSFRLHPSALFQERFRSFGTEFASYWRYIANDGMRLSVVILFIILAIYYESVLNLIPGWVPIPLLMAVIIGYLLARTTFRTFVHEADLVFVTPLEGKIDGYFVRAFWYNAFMHTLVLVAVLLLLLPVYTHFIPEHERQLLFYFLLPLLLKGWALQSVWTSMHVPDKRMVTFYAVLRFVFVTLIMYWFIRGGAFLEIENIPMAPIIFVLLFVAFFIVERMWKRAYGYHWLRLVENEEKINNRYYRLLNAFVDVPQRANMVHRRQWVRFIRRFIPFEARQAYRYLYVHSFFRSGEHFGIYIRLTVIGMVVVWAIPDIVGKWAAFLVFVFLVSSQLTMIWKEHSRQFWLSVFPIDTNVQWQSLRALHVTLLNVHAVFLFIPLLWQWDLGWHIVFLPLSAIGLAFAYTYVWMGKKHRVQNQHG